MAINDLISKLILEDQFSKAFDQYESRLTAVDSKTGQFKNSLGGLAVGFGVVVGGLAAAGVALDELTSKAVENQQAMFNVGAAAAAANSEFGDSVGTVESWTGSIKATSDQLRVFGDQDIANATARLIDMTKRLGFSEEQMQTLRARTADLSAGKVDLTGGIERVTAAMRGEAESAEYLGLSLNENTVKAYAEAHGLVWKNLSDGEKAQQRYQLFLEQTDALQGRAAESAATLAGQEAELARLRERQIADLGSQLLPLRQGEIELWKLLASTTQESGGIVTNVLAGITATLIAFGATGKAVFDAQIATLAAWGTAFHEVWAAVSEGRSPMEAVNKLTSTVTENASKQINVITGFGDTWSQAFEQVRSSYQGAQQAQQEFNLGTQASIGTQNQFATAGQAAAATVAEAYEKLAADREKLAASLNQRLEAAEFDHAQRIIRIQQDIVRAAAEAAAEAAAARTASNQKLAEGLAEIERGLSAEKVKAEAEANAQLAGLDQERAAAKRKAAGEIKKVQSDLKQALRSLEKETGQEIADINSDLADDLADKRAKAEQDKLDLIADFGEQAVRLEQEFANKRKSVNDQFESEFAEADPFRRKILEFNRKEALAQLDQQEAAEKTALEIQRDQAIQAVEDRVAAEAAILEREAQQKRERVTREAAERAEELKREAAERKAALEERLKEELEANARRQAEIRADLAAEQAQRDAAAQEARDKLIAKNAEELAAIDQQEAEKVNRAKEALDRENQNHADRLAQLQFANQQELSELQDKLAEVEREEAASYLRRLQEARSFADQREAILGGSGGASAGFGSNPGTLSAGSSQTNNNITVNNYGVQSGYAGAARTGRTVRDAINGF